MPDIDTLIGEMEDKIEKAGIPIRQLAVTYLATNSTLPPHWPGSLEDLDIGNMGEFTKGDIEYAIDRETNLGRIVLINNAKVLLMGQTEPGFEGCREAIPSNTTESITNLELGNFICVLTSEEHLSQVFIYRKLENTIEWFAFVTWVDPVKIRIKE